MKKFVVIAVIFFSTFSLMAFPGGKVVQETVKAAAKVSGKALSPFAERAAAKALAKAVAKYGDDALRITRQGGLEALKQGARYGDDFWRAARHAQPAAVRSLALHTRELLPLAKRIGPEFLNLEARAPGLASKAVRLFGDKAVKTLAKSPPDDISRLIGLARRTNSSKIRNLLVRGYASTPNKDKFLRALDWKKITAAGLSTAAIIAAYKVSDGAEEGLKNLARNNPEVFASVLSDWIAPFKWLIFIMLTLALWPFLNLLWKWSGIRFAGKRKSTAKETSSPEPQKDIGA